MKFSFVIPVYGTEPLLRRCLDSVLAQTCGDFEAVVVDDCSPGDCRSIVEAYDDRRLRYVRHDRNRGLLQARITGANAATGEFVVPVDSDDYVFPELIAQLARSIDGRPQVDVVVYHTVTETDGRKTPSWHNHAATSMSCREMLDELFAKRMFWTMWGKAFRRDAYLRAIDGLGIDRDFYINSTEDLCQMVPVLLTGREGVFIAYSGYCYFQNPESMTKRISSRRRVEKIASENSRSVAVSAAFAEKSGCSPETVEAIRALSVETILWLLSLWDDASDAEWSALVSQLARIYGLSPVVRSLAAQYGSFLDRLNPTDEMFAAPQPPRREPRTICIICARALGGGAERATYAWARRQVAAGRRIVWVYKPEYVTELEDCRRECQMELVPSADGSQLDRFRFIGNVVRDYDVDAFLLPSHWDVATMYDAVYAKAVGATVIAAEHSSFFFPLDDGDIGLYSARMRAYRFVDVITVLSPQNAAWWRAAGFNQAVYMPNYLPDLTARTGEVPAGIGFSRDGVLAVGRICERKGSLQVLEAFAELVRDLPRNRTRLTMTFLGRFDNETYRRRMLTAVRRLGVEEFVQFPGEVSDVMPYLNGSCLVVSGSRIEGAPISLMEARSVGIPVVAFALPYVDGIGESAGVVAVPQGDVVAMASAMRECLSDCEKYKRLSESSLNALVPYATVKTDERWNRLWQLIGKGAPFDSLSEPADAEAVLPMAFSALTSALGAGMKSVGGRSRSSDGIVRQQCELIRQFRMKFHDKLVEYGPIGVMRLLLRKSLRLLRR